MNLFIDAGNSRIKCRLVQGEDKPGEVAFDSRHFVAEMDGWLSGLAHLSVILVSSVLDEQFELWLTQRCAGLGLPDPEFMVTRSRGLAIQVGYEESAQLGIDRFLAMDEAYRQVGGAVIVVDCGTAVTIDAVDTQGQHLGGVIMPGIDLMRQALGAGTRGISAPDVEPCDALGRSTAQGVSSGCLLAVVGGIREALERQRACMSEEPELLFTGGQAGMVSDALGLPVRVCHNLVLDSLLSIAKRR